MANYSPWGLKELGTTEQLTLSLSKKREIELYNYLQSPVCARAYSVMSSPWDLMDHSPPVPLAMGFPRPGYWSELTFHTPGDLPDPGIKSTTLASPELAGKFLATNATWEWRRQWHPTPVLLPGKSHGQRSLVGCSPWSR